MFREAVPATDAQIAWLLAIAAGGGVGILYFGGLWWTVQRAAHASHPVLLIAGSFLFRGLLAAAALVAVAGGDPWRLLGAVGAFLVVRTFVVRLARAEDSSAAAHRQSPEEG